MPNKQKDGKQDDTPGEGQKEEERKKKRIERRKRRPVAPLVRLYVPERRPNLTRARGPIVVQHTQVPCTTVGTPSHPCGATRYPAATAGTTSGQTSSLHHCTRSFAVTVQCEAQHMLYTTLLARRMFSRYLSLNRVRTLAPMLASPTTRGVYGDRDTASNPYSAPDGIRTRPMKTRSHPIRTAGCPLCWHYQHTIPSTRHAILLSPDSGFWPD